MRNVIILLAVLVLLGAVPVAARKAPVPLQGYAPDAAPGSGGALLAASLYAADGLAANLMRRLDPGAVILAPSLVDVGHLDRTSAFGRLVAHQVGSRLAEHGLAVLEPRLRAALALRRDKGEFLLTRDAAAVLQDGFGAHAALVGVYQATEDEVYVSLRVVRLSDRASVAAYEYVVANDGAVRRLLAPEVLAADPRGMDSAAAAAAPDPGAGDVAGGMAAPWAVGGAARMTGEAPTPAAGRSKTSGPGAAKGAVASAKVGKSGEAGKVLVGESTGHLTDFDMQEGLAAVGDTIKLYILFETASARISDANSLAALDRLGAVLKTAALDKAVLEIGGHTDNRGTAAYNLALSIRRANAVRDYIIQKHGIAPNRLRAHGYGQTRPSASNDTEEGRADNRRVVVTRLQ